MKKILTAAVLVSMSHTCYSRDEAILNTSKDEIMWNTGYYYHLGIAESCLEHSALSDDDISQKEQDKIQQISQEIIEKARAVADDKNQNYFIVWLKRYVRYQQGYDLVSGWFSTDTNMTLDGCKDIIPYIKKNITKPNGETY
ncbi:hypothetical protein [Enterobacter sp. PTB]|uniref:hypothetical protein n=1 Tax=Enterobacter sp. PTB TaxID=3143437 RepID=UPI003DA8C8A7